MASDWETRTLGDLAHLHREQVDPRSRPEQVFRHFSLPAFDAGQAPVHEVGSSFGSQKFTVPPGAVLLSKLNPRIQRVWEPDTDENLPSVASTEFLVLVPRQGVDRRFLKYACLSPRVRLELESRVTGTSGSHQRVRPADALSIDLRVPSDFGEQRAIGRVLGALDDKIDVNQQANSNREALARSAFKSWFLDFDPVRDNSGKRGSRLPRALASLFPHRFASSQLGDIPQGWRVAALEECLDELESGGRPKGGVSRYMDGVPSIGAESIVGLGVFDYSKTRYVPHDFFNKMSKGHVKDRDVLLYKDGGRPGEFEPHVTLVGSGFPFSTCAVNEHVYRIRTNSALSQPFLFFWLSSEPVLEEMRIRGTGVAIPALNSTQVKSLAILVPPAPLVEAFDAIAEPMLARVLAACNESRTLSNMRDLLLPEVVSGDLRVGSAERIIGLAV